MHIAPTKAITRRRASSTRSSPASTSTRVWYVFRSSRRDGARASGASRRAIPAPAIAGSASNAIAATVTRSSSPRSTGCDERDERGVRPTEAQSLLSTRVRVRARRTQDVTRLRAAPAACACDCAVGAGERRQDPASVGTATERRMDLRFVRSFEAHRAARDPMGHDVHA